MIIDKKKILIEWAYRTSDGMPNPKSMAHQIILEGILKDYGWSAAERYELIRNLQEADEKKVPNPNPKTKDRWPMVSPETAAKYNAKTDDDEVDDKEEPEDDLDLTLTEGSDEEEDRIYGDSGNDTLKGGDNNDRLYGKDGKRPVMVTAS